MNKYFFFAFLIMMCSTVQAETESLVINNVNATIFTVKYDFLEWYSRYDPYYGRFDTYDIEANTLAIGHAGNPDDNVIDGQGYGYKGVVQFNLQQWYNMGLKTSGIQNISLIIKRPDYDPSSSEPLMIDPCKIESIGDMVQLENGIVPAQTDVISYYGQISNPLNGFTGFYFPGFYSPYDEPETYMNIFEVSVKENVLQDINQSQNWTGFIIEGEERMHASDLGADEVQLKITYNAVPEPSAILFFIMGLYPLLRKHKK